MPITQQNILTHKWIGLYVSLVERERVYEGTVSTSKSQKTVSVERAYLHYYPKYSRYERRRSKTLAHNPPCIAATTGDRVTIAECRPLSKEVSFVVIDRKGVAE